MVLLSFLNFEETIFFENDYGLRNTLNFESTGIFEETIHLS